MAWSNSTQNVPYRVASSVKAVKLPGAQEKGDLTDWVEERRKAGQSDAKIAQELVELIDKAPEFTAGALINPRSPRDTARRFLEDEFAEVDGVAPLRHWQDEWYFWAGPCWRPVTEKEMIERAYAWLERQRQMVDKKPERVRPTPPMVNNMLHALTGLVLVQSNAEAPCWIDPRPGDWGPLEMVSVENGLLHLPTAELRPHTPRLFAINSIQANWDAEAWERGDEPEAFLRFLSTIIERDLEGQTALLQEMFGYMLTPDTKHQTAFMLIGPKRSGKGTIGRILKEMHAQDYAAPKLGALGTRFGLQPLIGKTVAVVGDARTSSKTDFAAMAENILTVTGEDGQRLSLRGVLRLRHR